MPYINVLIAVDGGEHSLRAAIQGIELARQLKAKIALLFVLDVSKAMGNPDAGILPEQAMIVLRKEAEDMLQQIAKMYVGGDIVKLMPEGLPKEVILKAAADWQADLLVLGTHGRTGLTHLLMGSTAEYIVRHASVPVMVVPSKPVK